MDDKPREVTQLLKAWGNGDVQAREDLMPLLYRELRRRAGGYLRRERRDHTLQATALVHEAYVRLVGQDRVSWQNRGHFFGLASQMMRRILVDHARRRRATKRDQHLEAWGREVANRTAPLDCDVLLLDEALTELEAIAPRQVKIVELRYFGGLSEQEAADLMRVSRATVTREWQQARRWLYSRMTHGRI